MRRTLTLGGLLLAALSVAALALAGRAIYSRAAFGTWDPTAMPTRISYCDRTYLPGSRLRRPAIDATGNGRGVFPFRQVGTTAGGAPIFAKPLPDSVRHMYPNTAPLPCSMVVYLKVGANDYIAYAISGGP